MRDSYWWNRRGPVDPFVQELERLLRDKRARAFAAGRRRRASVRSIRTLGSIAIASAAAALVYLCSTHDDVPATTPPTTPAPPTVVDRDAPVRRSAPTIAQELSAPGDPSRPEEAARSKPKPEDPEVKEARPAPSLER